MSAGAENVACDVQIVHPKNGTNVGQSEQADGKAQKPAGTFLWLLAHRKGFAPWWPQGAGPTVPDPQTGTWSTLVFFGVPRDVNNEFEVAAIVVDKAGNDLLVKWVEDTNKSQVYVPIAMPNPVTGCTPQLVTVRKTN
jgi:hypothetical protein